MDNDSSLKTCRWNWCRAVFVYQEELVQHVLTAHIATAKPVKRKDIPMLKRTEQGTQATNVSGTELSLKSNLTQPSTPSQKTIPSLESSQLVGLAQPREVFHPVSQEDQSVPPATDDPPLFHPDSPELGYPPEPLQPPVLKLNLQTTHSQTPSAERSPSKSPSINHDSTSSSSAKRKEITSTPPLPRSKKRRPFPPTNGYNHSQNPEPFAQDQRTSQKEPSPPLFKRSPPEEPDTSRSGQEKATTPQPERQSSRHSSTQAPGSQEHSRSRSRSQSQSQPQVSKQPPNQVSRSQSQSQTPVKSRSRSNSRPPVQGSGSYLESGLQYFSNALRTRVLGRTPPIPEDSGEQDSTREEQAGTTLGSQLMTQAPFTYGYSSQSQSQ